MTPNPQNADKFDVEEVERELNKISFWPWKRSETGNLFTISNKLTNKTLNVLNPDETKKGAKRIAYIPKGISKKSVQQIDIDFNFISKSPQRLAAAVERIRFLEDVVNKYQLRIEKAAVSPPNALNKSSDYLDGWVEGLESIMATSILKSSDEE